MMKKDWTIKKLGEVCEIKDSQRKPITANKRKPGPIPYYGATGILDYVEDYLFDEDLILLGEDGAKWGSGDRSAFKISGKTWVNNHAHVLKPANYIDYTWLIYYLNYSDLTPFVKGATVPKLNQENTRNIPIPLPPLEEQKRIVAVLDKKFAQIETLKTTAEKNLQNTKQLFQAELEKVFSNTSLKEMSLQDVCTKKITDGTHQTPKYCTKEEGGIPFISSKDVTKEYIDWTNIKYIVPELHEVLYKRIAPQKDDILLAKNGTTGIGAIVEDDKIFDIYVTLAVLRPNVELVKPRYLLTVVNSPLCKRQFNAHLKGSGVPNLHLEEIQKVIIPVPSLKEQEEIIKKVESLKSKVHQLEEIYTKQLADCDELKQSLLQKAFEGEL